MEINIMRTCKRKDLILTFATVNVTIEHGTQNICFYLLFLKAIILIILKIVTLNFTINISTFLNLTLNKHCRHNKR